ncbi:gp53-like domain-containing protein [Huaxiibacter chinensis]|uniref:gp53-like domain-containing protein n=1 Tax=Huaxiibacter chinensis TaxID=2899785 RepID=UPI003F9E9CA1
MRPLMPPVQTPDNLFHDGNPLTGELGTIVDAEHLNNEQAAIRDTQSELIAILTAAAMEPESTAGQLLAALNKLYAPLNDTLGALSSLVGGANKLPYFTSANAAALTALSSIGRDIVGKATVADVLTYLGLSAFHSDSNFTSVSSPTGKTFIFVTDAGNWGCQDSVGNPLPLAIANGGTGANTLLGARVQLNISAFGSDNDRTTMSSPGATAFIFIDKNGDWGALDASGRTIGLPVSRGGTGATDAAGARAAFGLGSAATRTVGTQASQIPDMSAFQYSATAKGYERMPNGMLRQWGTISIPAANDSTNVALDTFQIPFPNGVLSCKVNGTDTLTNTPCFATAEAASKTQIRLKAVAIDLQNKTITQGMAVNVAWEAIGA